jgi:hypothetical protein
MPHATEKSQFPAYVALFYSILRTEMICPSEILINIHRAKIRYIAEGMTAIDM